MFGNFNLNAGLSQLHDLGGRFQKIREDLEQNIESSLRTNLAPTAEGGTPAADISKNGDLSLTESWEGYSLSTSSPAPAQATEAEIKDPKGIGQASLTAPLSVPDPPLSAASGPSSVQSSPRSQQSKQHDQQPDKASSDVHHVEPEQREQQPATHIENADIDTPKEMQQKAPQVQPEPDEIQHNDTDRATATDHTDADSPMFHEATQETVSVGPSTGPASEAEITHEGTQQTDNFLNQEGSTADPQANAEGALSITALDTGQLKQPWQGFEAQHAQPAPSPYENGHQPVSEDPPPTDTDKRPPDDDEHVEQPQSDSSANGVQPVAQDQQKHARDDLAETDIASMDQHAVWAVIQRLQAGLQAREKQLERQSQQLSDMHHVQEQLQARNEELVVKAAKVSEDDMAAVQAECERRVGAAERKAYALAKERDALRRGSDKLSSANDLLREKDNIIAQVMEEGERLSKKQSSMEGTIKKLRQQIRELEAGQTQAATKLAGEESKLEAAVKARQQAEAALATAVQQHKQDAEQQKQHSEALLARSRASQAAAEEKAATSAKEGLEKRAREAESQAQALADTVEELRLALDRQRASAELREEGLRGEVRDLEGRCQAAEARHQDLAANIPEATRPLLRQLEAMQASASANTQAWAAAEANLTARLSDSEGSAAAAGEREKRAWEKVQAANTRLAASAAALDALKTELADADAKVELAQSQQRQAESRTTKAVDELRQTQQAQNAALERQAQLETTLAQQLAEEQAQSLAASEAAEERVQRLEQRLASHAQASTAQAAAGDPPAMPAPGYEWQLVRSSEKGLPPRNLSSASLASASASDRGTDGLAASAGQQPRLQSKGAADAERLRTILRQKEDQIASLQSQLTNLEATRDSLAEEVVAAAGTEEAARAAEAEAATAREEHTATQQQLLACTEMLGEKEERLEELRADLQDVKQLYKDQIEFMVEQLAHLTQQGYVSSPFKQVQERQTQSPEGQQAAS